MRALLLLTLAVLCGCGVTRSAPALSFPAEKPWLTPLKPVLPPADAAVGPRDPAFMPLGVYWAGEYLFDANGAIDWPRNEQALDDMAIHHVNTVWLTHRSAAETAEFARRAAKRGIYLVASIAELAGDVLNVRKNNHQTLIERTQSAWGDAPKPIAWGLGDEPRTSYMDDMAAYVKDWKRYAPKEPVTTVVMWQDIDAAAKAGFDALCADIYPFFSAGNPNAYPMPDWLAWLQNVRKLRVASKRPWMMGQSYQEPWGPYEVDATGNIFYLPGGAPHWVMPTPAQISWQALSAVAEGAKGMFYFLFRWPAVSNPGAEPASLPAAVKQRTDSGAPKALIYPDGRSTPQYEAVSKAFAWINRFATVLAPLHPTSITEAWAAGGASANVVSVMIDPKTDKRYLMVVAAPETTSAVKINLGPHITGLIDLASGKRMALTSAVPFRSAIVTLSAGTAALFACEVDRANLPMVYTDNFTTEKFATDALKVQNVQRKGDGVLSAVGGESYEQAFVVYDMKKLLPPLPAGGFRMLIYDAASNPPDLRGAFWSASSDGRLFEKLSYNESGKPVLNKQRYLKVGLSWSQSNSAFAYGCLKQFTMVQWSKAAE